MQLLLIFSSTIEPGKVLNIILQTVLYFLYLGLDVYTTLNVSVAANNSFGIGMYSQPIQVKTLESSKYFLALP